MKRKSLAAAMTLGILAGCASAPSGSLSLPLQERLRNPLVAERYWSEMAEHMADFVRTKNPVTKDPIKAAAIESERLRALERVGWARAQKNDGSSGLFASVTAIEDVIGEALLYKNTLFFGSSFEVTPNPSIQVYLTTAVDPRDGAFPDATSLNLGALQTAYGPQEYEVPDGKVNETFRTVVLYDARLERVIGFAQLSR